MLAKNKTVTIFDFLGTYLLEKLRLRCDAFIPPLSEQRLNSFG
jgi:hypothetical protein